MRARVEQDEKGRRQVHEACATPCAIERGMRIIGGKWTGSILWHLKDGPVRFNDLCRMIGGASKKMITERLRRLEAQGVNGGAKTDHWAEQKSASLGMTVALANVLLV